MATINGTSGNDVLGPSPGNEQDTLYGFAGDDTLYGGGGTDILYGGTGNDLLFGGTGSDRLYGDDGNDILYGDSGTDVLYGDGGNDTLFGGADNDTLFGGDGDDWLNPGAGNDQLYGGAGLDIVDFGTATANISYNFGTASVLSVTGFNSNTLVGIEGINLGSGNDSIIGNADNNVMFGNAGNDSLYGGGGADSLYGGTGADQLYGGDGNDWLDGGAGNDWIDGGAGQDIVDFGAATVNISYNFNSSTIGVDGTDTLVGIEGINLGSGDDSVIGNAADNIMFGNAGNDTLYGGAGNDLLDGGSGADRLYGGVGNDTIDGGSGDDVIYGGPETSAAGDGPLSLDFNWTLAGNDEANLAGGVTQNTGGINVSTSFTPGFSGATFTVESSNNPVGNDFDRPIYVAPGETFNPASSAELFRPGGQTSSSPPTVLRVDFSAVPESGLADEVQNVQFRISDIDDGQFRDRVIVRAFDANGNEIQVNIITSSPSLIVSGNTIEAVNGVGLLPDNPNGSVLIEIPGPVAYFTITYDNLETAQQAIRVSDIQFDAVAAADNDSLIGGEGNDTIFAGIGEDTLIAGLGNDILYGGAGNDTLYGDEGNDLLFGGAGNDLLYGGADADTLYGDAGNDLVYGGEGNDLLYGGEGTDTLYGGAGNDVLVAGPTGDFLFGGTGDDTLVAGAGADSLNGGPGLDFVDYSGSNAGVTVDLAAGTGAGGHAEGDTLSGVDGIYGSAFDDVLYGFDGQGTVSGDVFTNIFYGGAGNDYMDGFGGDDILYGGADNDTILGGAGNDLLYGDEGNDLLYGGTGVDTLYGGVGEDTLYGGAGADVLYGGDGNDLIFIGGADVDTLVGGGPVEFIYGGGGQGSAPGDFDVLDLTGLYQTYGWTRIRIEFDENDPENGTVLILDGPNGNVIGSIVFDNIEEVIRCFTPGTMLRTDRGEVAVEDLVAGDLVLTRDNGLQPLRWVGRQYLSAARLRAQPELRPVRISVGALGPNLPARSMVVSPQHRVLVEGSRAELLFGESEVLVPAKHLQGATCPERSLPEDGVTYIHLLFDRHEVVLSDGIWTESFQPAQRMLSAMEDEVRAEVLAIFPELEDGTATFTGARLSLRAHEARVLFAAE